MGDLETFNPASMSVRQIFCDPDAVYKVPDYQRRYSWKKEQLDALWGDLYESFQNDPKACYFLGSIVVVKNEDNKLELIDGQQRITTLMIMISVLNKTYPNLNCQNPQNPEDESSQIDSETLSQCLYFKKGKKRLTLQTAPEYDSDFNSSVIDVENFADFVYPTKSQLKKDNPVFNFKYAAKFFYDKFQELADDNRKKFIFYIFNRVKMIRIICHDLSFAIKLFQVMNDRGMPLAAADIIKSYILGKIEAEESNDDLKKKFASNWKWIEDIVNKHGLKMDDFMVFYEYYKLKSNPKRQVVDELKTVIKNNDIYSLVDELKSFSNSLDEVMSSKDSTMYSLRYIPWPTYVRACLTSAFQVKYGIKTIKNDEKEIEDKSELRDLIHAMRRYFYLAYISGKTLNQIKQTSFNLLAAIVDKKPIEDITRILDESISKYKMIKGTYEALKDDVYGEVFLKPLMLSLEYQIREATNTTFVEINKDLHMDHILPQAFENNSDWNYVDKDEAPKYLNKLGNMALLYCKKNEEALNKGFEAKCNIYQGKNPNGTSGGGVTSFNTTIEIVDSKQWNLNDIKRRGDIQMGRIEQLLDISDDMIETDPAAENAFQIASGKASRFNFNELGIKPGEYLYWFNDSNIKCEVVDDHKVRFNGVETTLSKIASDKIGYRVNGALYFNHKGKTISDIRKEAETQQNL